MKSSGLTPSICYRAGLWIGAVWLLLQTWNWAKGRPVRASQIPLTPRKPEPFECFAKSLPHSWKKIWAQRIQQQLFLSTLSPPLAVGFLSHISPPTLFLLLSPRLKLVGDLLPWISAGNTASNQMSDFFTPLARIGHLPCKLPAFSPLPVRSFSFFTPHLLWLIHTNTLGGETKGSLQSRANVLSIYIPNSGSESCWMSEEVGVGRVAGQFLDSFGPSLNSDPIRNRWTWSKMEVIKWICNLK